MAYKLEDGTGSRNKVAVIENRIRTFAEEQSLVNYQSVKSGNLTKENILNGEVIGTFTIRDTMFTTNNPNNDKTTTLSLSNNDPINLMVIDRVHIQFSLFDITLPDPRISVSIDNISSFATPVSVLNVQNENQESNIKPLVQIFRAQNRIQQIASTNLAPRIFPTLGAINELIPQGSDSIIVAGAPPITVGVATPISGSPNTISISVFNVTGATRTFNAETFIRFSMVSPGDTG